MQFNEPTRPRAHEKEASIHVMSNLRVLSSVGNIQRSKDLAMVPDFYFLPSLQPPAMMPCILRALIRYETARCSEWMLIWVYVSADIARVNECKYVPVSNSRTHNKAGIR
jgi:hypothetical protein